MEKGMVTHSSILTWRIPLTEEPGGLQSIGSQRVGHDCSDLAHMHTEGGKRSTAGEGKLEDRKETSHTYGG